MTPIPMNSPVPACAARFIRQGVRAAALKGGIAEWLAGKLPVETKDAPQQTAPEPGALKG